MNAARLLVLGIYAATAGCFHARPRFDVSGAGPGDAATAVPSVVVVTSSASCPRSAPGPLESFVSEDAEHLRSAFGPKVEVLPDPSPSALRGALEGRTRPVVLFYSGPGRSSARGTGSELCLSGGRTIALVDLALAIPTSARWAVLIINACQSADVDVSHIELPISVISASPELVAERFGAARRGSFADTVASVIRLHADPNHDGILSDQELFTEVAKKLDGDLTVAETPRAPIVKLRRQAGSHLPIVLLGAPRHDVVASRLSEGLDRELADEMAVVARLAEGRSWELPSFRDRYVAMAPDLAALGPRLPPGTRVFGGDRAAAELIVGRALGLDVFAIGRGDEDHVQRVLLPDRAPVFFSVSESGSWRAAVELALPCEGEVLPETDPPVARFPGAVRGECFEVDGEPIPRARLQPVPCPRVSEGQCFELPVNPPGRRDPRVCSCAATTGVGT